MASEDEGKWLAEQFEEKRNHLRAVAYRMLGSLNEADDAIQEAWLRLSRTDAGTIDNLGGWLTTVVARVCLDMLRSRASRREDSLDTQAAEPVAVTEAETNPEQEVLLADSVGLALLVVLDRLAPAERLAFVLHDLFAVSFDEIASILGRSPEAARQLASRARRRVQGASAVPHTNLSQQREIVDAFLRAVRSGDVDTLITILDPDLVVRLDESARRPGTPAEVRGASNWVKQAIAFSKMVRSVQPAIVDGSVGVIWAPGGHLFRVLRFTFDGQRVAQIDVIADPARLRELDLRVLND